MKLVLLGTADSMTQAPFGDPTWEIWACQPAISYPACKRVDRIFELHDESYWRDPQIIVRMNAANVPIVMQHAVAELPKSEVLPLSDMAERFKGFTGARYFTSTIAYMIAYALYLNLRSPKPGLGYEEIALYGVHMAADEEYGNQRQAMEYWVGVANGLGVKVTVPDRSSICSARFLYGYDTESTMLTEMRKMSGEFQQGLSQAKAKVDTHVQEMYEYSGAVKALAKLRRIYS